MQTENVRYLGCVEWFDDEKGSGVIRDGAGSSLILSFRDIDEPGFMSVSAWQIISFEREWLGGRWNPRKVRVEDRGPA